MRDIRVSHLGASGGRELLRNQQGPHGVEGSSRFEGTLTIPWRLVLFFFEAPDFFDDDLLEFHGVDDAGVAVEDFAVFADEEGVGHGAVPLGIEGFGEVFGVAIKEVVVGEATVFFQEFLGAGAGADVLLFEKLGDFVDVFRGVEADGDELEILEGVLFVDGREVGKLGDTGAATGGPDVEKAEGGAGFVGNDFCDGGGVDGFDDDGLGIPLFIGFGDGICFFEPLGGAAGGAGFDDGRFLAGNDGGEGVAAFVLFGGAETAASVIHASVVFELEVGVEDEDVRGGNGAIGFGDFLGFAIVEVGEIELLFFGEEFHVFEGVAVDGESEFVETEAFGRVAVDGGEADALVLEFFDKGFHAAEGGDGVGAVIGGEDDGGGLLALNVGEGVGFVVDAGEFELGGGGSLFQRDRGVGEGHRSGRSEGAGGENESFHCGSFTG